MDYDRTRDIRDQTAGVMAQLLEPHHRVAMLTESEPRMAAVQSHLSEAIDAARTVLDSYPMDMPPPRHAADAADHPGWKNATPDEEVRCFVIENGCVMQAVIGAVVQLDALDEIQVALSRERRDRDARRATRSTGANNSEH